MTTLILAIGNILMTDEGVGAETIRQLAASLPADAPVRYMDGGTLGFALAAAIADHPRLIVVDAAALGEAPGSVRVFEDAAMDRQLSAHASTVHEVSLSDLFDIARLTDSLPAHRALVGIEPGRIDWGETLTPEVAAAVPAAVARILELLERWDRSDPDGSADQRAASSLTSLQASADRGSTV